ncbi:sulfotransferase family protein [Pseudoroseicyclus sp. H15]
MPKDFSEPAEEGVSAVTAAFGNEINAFFHISLKHRYLYVQTPKVASTTVKSKLIEVEIAGSGIPRAQVPPHPDRVGSVHVKPYQLPPHMLQEVLEGEFTRFCFVRDPFARVLSAYLDKILNEPADRAAFCKGHGVQVEDDITFADFVELLWTHRDRRPRWDPHWRPQWLLLRPDLVRYGLIGKIESFDADFAALDARLGGLLGAYEARAPHRTNAAALLAEHYTPEIREKVALLYGEDFRRFGYEAG